MAKSAPWPVDNRLLILRPGGNSWRVRAYVDESFGFVGDRRVYLVAAACIAAQDQPHLSQRLKEMNPRRGKLHWHKERAKTRLELLTWMSRLRATYHVVIRDSQDERPERQRRMCLQILMSQLNARGVEEATLESRGRTGDRRDHDVLDWQIAAGIAPTSIRHVHGSEEPALWLADFVCGATWSGLNGNTAYISILAQMNISTTTTLT